MVSSLDGLYPQPPYAAMHLVILTGAGISADSGVATFRDPDGLWEKFDWRKLATPEAYAAMPETVHEFYNMRRRGLGTVAPNPAHLALAALEAALIRAGHRLTLITQNVDDLHERAGSRAILPMHGRLDRAQCTACEGVHTWRGDLTVTSMCPECKATGTLRPWIVWFGEMPRHLDEIDRAMQDATAFAAIGTSGSVYPAAGLVSVAKQRAIPTTALNLDPSDNASLFDERIYGPAAQTVPVWADALIDRINQEEAR